MKKALAILMTFALVSMVAFADVATTITTAPTVTIGASATVEADLAKGNVIPVTAPGKSATAADSQAVKSEPYGLNGTKLVSNDWVNLDWSKMSIKAEGKVDAYRSSADDYSFLKVTTTWKNFFGFAIAHTYARDNKEAASADATNIQLNKNITNEVSVTMDKKADVGVIFSTVYDAEYFASNLSLFYPMGAPIYLANGFKKINFEYDNAEFYAKLTYLNNQTDYNVTKTTAGAPAKALDTAIIEARKMFNVWTVRINDSAENKIRVQNLGSDCKVADVESFVVGKDKKIQDAANKGLNFYNTITPVTNLTIKLNALAPSNTDTLMATWLNGDNLVMGAAYTLDKVGTFDAGLKVKNDYVKNDGINEAPTNLFSFIDATHVITAKPVSWQNAFWVGAKLDKLLGDNKAVYVGMDMTLGSYLDANASYKEWVNQTDTNKTFTAKVGTATKTNINLETKDVILGDGTAPGSLTVNAGLLATIFAGDSYAARFPTVVGTTVTEGNFRTGVLDTINPNLSWISKNYNEANYMNKNYYNAASLVTPFQLKARVDYAVNATLVNVYLKDSYKALAGDLSTVAISGGRAIYGYYDTNQIELGAKLQATKKGSLSATVDYNMYLGLPTASDLYFEGATDAAKKTVDQSYTSKFNSGDFSPFKVAVGYTYAY